MNPSRFVYGTWPHALLAAAGVLLAASAAFAADGPVVNPSDAPWQPAKVVERLEGLGYTNVRDVEWDDGAWELEAVNPDGRSVDLTVDPKTGAVVQEDLD